MNDETGHDTPASPGETGSPDEVGRHPHTPAHDAGAARLDKLQKLRALGVEPYPWRFDKDADAADLQAKYAELPDDTVTGDVVRVAGRVRANRNTGMFIDLHDSSGKIQVFCHKDNMSEAALEIVRLVDIGDMIGVTGRVRRTKRGELTVNAETVEVLAKGLLPLPEKFHGLTDHEARLRQRYVDLIVNEESRERLRARSHIVSAVRETLTGAGFLEVETPMLHPIIGGAAARPFVTHHNTLDMELFLRIAPELYLKRLIVGGLSERVFEINRSFRNEGISTRHNPEFTMLEAYQAYADYHDMMRLAERIIAAAAAAASPGDKDGLRVKYGEHEIDLSGPFPARPMHELVREASGIDFLAIDTAAGARQAAQGAGAAITGTESWGEAMEAAFAATVEHTLIQPVHVTDLPKDISPLAKIHRDDPRLTERFETFINGWEIANAFSELTDPADQFERFEDQMRAREAGNVEAAMMDRDYVTALEIGLPPTGGLGMGIDRLTMILTDAPSIRDVILFPTLRRKS